MKRQQDDFSKEDYSQSFDHPGIWEIESLFNFILSAGCYLEENWEYFPSLS